MKNYQWPYASIAKTLATDPVLANAPQNAENVHNRTAPEIVKRRITNEAICAMCDENYRLAVVQSSYKLLKKFTKADLWHHRNQCRRN